MSSLSQIKLEKGSITGIAADVTDPEEVKKVFEELDKRGKDNIETQEDVKNYSLKTNTLNVKIRLQSMAPLANFYSHQNCLIRGDKLSVES